MRHAGFLDKNYLTGTDDYCSFSSFIYSDMGSLESSRRKDSVISVLDFNNERCVNLLKLLQKGNVDGNVNAIAEALVSIYCAALNIEKKRTYKFVLTVNYGKVIRNMIIQAQPYTGYESGSPRFFMDFKPDEGSNYFMRVSYSRDLRTLEDRVVASIYREGGGANADMEPIPRLPDGEKGHGSTLERIGELTRAAGSAAREKANIAASRASVDAQKSRADAANAATRKAISDRQAAVAAAANVVPKSRENASFASYSLEKIRNAIQLGNRELIFRELENLNLFLTTGQEGDNIPLAQKRFISLMGKKFTIMRDLEKFILDLGLVVRRGRGIARMSVPLGGGGKFFLMMEYCNDRLNIIPAGELSDAVRGRWESMGGAPGDLEV